MPGPIDRLPIDPDVDADEGVGGVPLPTHLRPDLVALVIIGGALGTAARYLITALLPPPSPVPWAVLGINVLGALLLGVLLETLALRGADAGRRRALRLLLGTGVLGGFTTYSALAVDTVTLGMHHVLTAAAYAVGSAVLGVVAAATGIALARRLGTGPLGTGG